MRNKALWLVAGWSVLLLVLTPALQAAGQEMVTDSLGRSVQKPQYGGVLTEIWRLEPAGFDPSLSSMYTCSTVAITNEPLVGGDWRKGPAGTGETSWDYNYTPPREVDGGLIAQSWEVPGPDTIVYHIRKGMKWHNKPPMNGRELVADDVVFGIHYLLEGKGFVRNYRTDIVSVTAPDKHTVVIKSAPGKASVAHSIAATYSPIMPREVIEEHKNMTDWKVSCGTGPFILTEYVSGSHATLERNPEYWQKDPLHPENPIPYISGIKRLFISDLSTQLAGTRTGKIDIFTFVSNITWDDAQELIGTNPELKWRSIPPGHGGLAFGGKVTEPPFNDVRVRQALMLAIDHEAVAKDYYAGKAHTLSWPIPNVPGYQDVYTPPGELPRPLRELFEHHPEKAKQLLAEAGYPDGFKTEVVCMKDNVDVLSVVKSNWAAIGVDLNIDIKERGAWVAMVAGKKFPHMITTYSQPLEPLALAALAKGAFYNVAVLDDPRIESYFEASQNAWPDSAKQRQLLKDVTAYIIEQCFYVFLPAPYSYTFWQPWVKAYNGESYCGYMATLGHASKYLWLDVEMKTKR